MCPRCGSEMKRKEGPHGSYLQCTQWPKCDFTQRVYQGQPVGMAADTELRQLRIDAHELVRRVQALWRMEEEDVKAKVAWVLHLPQCHFGTMNKHLCRKAIQVLRRELRE